MKLLIVSPSQGHYGGIDAFVIALASAIKNWPEFEVQLCFKLVQGWELKDDLRKAVNASLVCPVHYVRRGEADLLKLIRWADIVHGQNTSPDVIFPSWFLRKKLVLTIHNWRQRQFNVHSVLWGLGARLAQRRWYNSRFVWNTWEPKKKLRTSDCVPTVCHFPKAWCAPAERIGFLFMGRWIENKGIDDLVIAYSRAKLDPLQWPLILVGNGPLRAKIESLIKDLGVQGVEITGFIDDQSKGMRLASARWLVAPARTREDLGLTPIEARSVGVPVIATRDGGLPESGGDAALMVEPGNIEALTDALKQAASMSDREYCERGERGQTTLKDYLRPMEFYRKSYTAVYRGES
jgi:glycosyltransferase involved in cell wall biosynthesis